MPLLSARSMRNTARPPPACRGVHVCGARSQETPFCWRATGGVARRAFAGGVPWLLRCSAQVELEMFFYR